MFGQLSFIRRNVYTLVFVIDPSTELGLHALGFIHDVYAQGAPVRLCVVLAPGMSTRRVGVSHPSPYLEDRPARLRALEGVYELAGWEALAAVEAEAAEAAEARESGGAADGGGLDEDMEKESALEAERLGMLLTKLFIFCKRKVGNQASLRFIGLTREVRERGGGFFGPPQVDALSDGYLQQAFDEVVLKKIGREAARAIFEGLRSGELADYDDDVAAAAEFVKGKGLSELPLVLVNGAYTKLTEDLEQQVMQALGAEAAQVTELVRSGVIDDETTDFLGTIANATTTFPRYNRELLLPSDKIRVLPLRPHEALSHLRWVHSPLDGAQRAVGREAEGAAEHGGGGGFHPVSMIYVLDLLDPSHIVVAAQALVALEADTDVRLRIGILHYPSAPSDAHLAAAAAWDALAVAPEPIGALRRWLALQLLSLKSRTSVGALLPKLGLSDGGEALFPETIARRLVDALEDPARAMGGRLGTHAQLCGSLGLAAGAPAVIANGRLVELALEGEDPSSSRASVDEVDLQLLAQFEWKQRAQGAAELIETMVGSEGGVGGALSRSDLQQFAVAEASRAAQSSSGGGRQGEYVFKQDDIPCGAACVRLPGSGAGEALELVVILDPLTKEAQRFTPILSEIQRSLGLTVILHLNPHTDVSEFPLESFYRYVVSLEPTFDAFGNSLAHVTDHALFSSMRTPAVLTLHVDAPEAWLIECTEAAYDMDNIRLSELNDKRTVSASYELASLLFTGSCEDLTSRKPPNGLQLILGTAAERHVTDTLVMSNLGYFQLKAAPGLYQLELAPGPSSEVYEIITGAHSLGSPRRRGRGQQIDPSLLRAVTQQQVVLSGFEGEATSLLVRKRAGMEKASILDDDKRPPSKPPAAGGEESPHEGVLDNLARWWSGGSNGDKSGETIHIFSLASGHLYERFLRIMMQSVLDRTDRPIKFWLLKNFLSPAFIGMLPAMAQSLNFEYGLVEYQWPTWLHKQTNKQRIIWGYKILFLDVMFPLNVRKIIYIDADQVVNSDVAELWNMDLGRAAVGMTPFCQKDENKETSGFRFFAQGYWKDHLQGRPYHISALFVVDLYKFRRRAYGDQYRIFYDSLSKDPHSLSNLDQDLPNYAQHVVPIHSLPEEWLWCETWCGNASKPNAKTIDLCNNPLTKEPKLSQATRVIGERWSLYDERSKALDEQQQQRAPTDAALADAPVGAPVGGQPRSQRADTPHDQKGEL